MLIQQLKFASLPVQIPTLDQILLMSVSHSALIYPIKPMLKQMEEYVFMFVRMGPSETILQGPVYLIV